eukprot:3232704-Pyramimonas_sp.AAC.1
MNQSFKSYTAGCPRTRGSFRGPLVGQISSKGAALTAFPRTLICIRVRQYFQSHVDPRATLTRQFHSGPPGDPNSKFARSCDRGKLMGPILSARGILLQFESQTDKRTK